MDDPPDLNYTKIIATLGPASRESAVIEKLVRAGADCFRINFSYTNGPEAQPVIDRVREVSRRLGVFTPILADIQGPKLRVGPMPEGGVELHEDQCFTLTGRGVEGSDKIVQSQYGKLADDVAEGVTILLADGTIELCVEQVRPPDVVCRVIHGGRLRSNAGLNIPRAALSVPTLTEKDHRDLRWIAESDVDIVAISFVRSADDIAEARRILGCERNKVPVMAKLERPEVLDRLDEVLESSDGVMIARGDLAVEVPFEQVPMLQKQILRRAAARGKWAVVATQMLRSMVHRPRPSRAEVSDVANAVLDGADAIMLSEETAMGEHPARAVQAMARISAQVEVNARSPIEEVEQDIMSFAVGAANAAVSAAGRLGARAIVALAGSGPTALVVSKWRPHIPILALSKHDATLRRFNVLRGVVPVPLSQTMTMEEQLEAADRFLLANGWAASGDITVCAAAVPLGQHKETNSIRFHHVRTS